MKKLNKKIWIPSAAVLVLLVVAIILLLTRCGSCVDGHSWSEWTELTEATCSVEGEKIHTCTVCGKEEIVDSETTEHDYRTVWDSGETRHWQECVDCGAKCNAEYHTPGEWEIVTEPACETVGTKKRACSVCEKEEIETLEATGHTYTESWSINSIKHFHKCTTCGTKVKTEVHAYDKWTTEGSRKWSNCKTCGYKCVQEVTKAQSITLSGGKSLTVGGTLQLTATAGSSRLTSRNATWSSSDKSVATVDSNGKVTGRKLGSADITVTSGEGAKKTVTVWVTETAIDG